MELIIILLIFLLVQALVIAFFTQALATAKGYNSNNFFWMGFCFSIIGFLFVHGLPIAKERN
jgi:uncharacterized membrane protein